MFILHSERREMENVIDGIGNGTKQLVSEGDPSMVKLENETLHFLDGFSKRISLKSEEYLKSLEENFIVCLFSLILFVIIILVLISNLNDILYQFQINLMNRRYVILLIITMILFWIFFSVICSSYFHERDNWFLLKLILFCLFSICISLLIFLCFRFLFIYQKTFWRNKSIGYI